MERAEKICHFCETRESPLWRKDKDTGRTLCNACGLYIQRAKKRNSPESPMKRRSASIPSGLPVVSPYDSAHPKHPIIYSYPTDLSSTTTTTSNSNSSSSNNTRGSERSYLPILKANTFTMERGSSSSRLDEITSVSYKLPTPTPNYNMLKLLAIEAEKESFSMYKNMPKFYRQQYATVPKLSSSLQNTSSKEKQSFVSNETTTNNISPSPLNQSTRQTNDNDDMSIQTKISTDHLVSGHPIDVPVNTIKSGSIVEYFANTTTASNNNNNNNPSNALYAIIQHILLDGIGDIYFLPIPLKPRISSRRGSCCRIEDLEVEPNVKMHIDNQPITYSMLQPIGCINKIIVY